MKKKETVSKLTDNPALLKAFKEGRQTALHEVYLHYLDDVDSLVRNGFHTESNGFHIRGISHPEDRKEIIQEVFIRAFSYNARIAYDGIRPYKTYLFTIARNLMIDRVRKSARDAMHHVRQDDTSLPSAIEGAVASKWNAEAKTGEAQLHFDSCINELGMYFDKLSKEEREFIQVRFVEELPQRDVAQRLGITRWKARILEKRLLKGMKSQLKQKGLWR